jgi:hypothetical protein
VAEVWAPFDAAAGDDVDWWPDDVPVVMGEVVGLAKASHDSGLRLEDDRVLLRVVGRGGAT